MRRPLKREGTTRLCKRRAGVLFLFFLSVRSAFFFFLLLLTPDPSIQLIRALPPLSASRTSLLPHAAYIARINPPAWTRYNPNKQKHISLPSYPEPWLPSLCRSPGLSFWSREEKRPTAGFLNFFIHHAPPDAKTPQGRKIRLLPRQTSEVEADTGQGVLVYLLQVQNSHPYSSFCWTSRIPSPDFLLIWLLANTWFPQIF